MSRCIMCPQCANGGCEYAGAAHTPAYKAGFAQSFPEIFELILLNDLCLNCAEEANTSDRYRNTLLETAHAKGYWKARSRYLSAQTADEADEAFRLMERNITLIKPDHDDVVAEPWPLTPTLDRVQKAVTVRGVSFTRQEVAVVAGAAATIGFIIFMCICALTGAIFGL